MNSTNVKPQNRIRAICFTAVLFIIAVLLIFSPLIFGGIASENVLPNELYTFEQDFTEPDGTVARVYASGDSDFRYLHDGDGYLLTEDSDGYLRYAKNDGGRVEATGVRWNASSLQKSFIDKMTSEDLVRDKNPKLKTSHEYDADRPSVLAESRGNTVYNVVIFIAFADSRLTEADIPTKIRETFSNDTGTYNSLKNYFAAQTSGEKELVNLFAYEDGAVFVYVSPRNRIYYSFTLTEDTRIKRERELLTSAAAAFNAAEKDEVSAEDLDADGDGYADAVSFVLLDRPVSTQGSILWPHKWHMASIGARAEICGVPIGVYSLNFTASHFVTFAHETGHVLGAPDYYASTNNGMPLVAEWDVMSITQRSGSPANMLAYTRKKYLGMKAGVIETVRAGQTVTLRNAADVRDDDVLAVRIPTDVEGVYVYAEYRAKAEEDEFDGGQKSYGLVVYRVNENVGGYGNINARTVTDYSNIEVFVYRKSGANNLNAVYSAALNAKEKTDFNALGSGTDTPLTVNGKTVLDACFSDVWENDDGTVSFTVNGDGIKSDYDGQFTVKGATAADWTYFAKEGERFTVDIGQALPTSQGTVRAFYDYDTDALTEVSSSGMSKTFEVNQSAAAVETVTVRIRDEISSCQMKFAIVTDGRVARKAEIKQGTESPVYLGDGWETVTAVGIFGGEEKALKDIEPLVFNAWSGVGSRRVYFNFGTELYSYDLTVADRPVYMETEVEEISLLVGETLPDGVSATVHFASGEERTVSITDCEAVGFVNSGTGTVTVTLKYGADDAEVSAELKVSFARPFGAEISGTTTEFEGKTYPTAELISSDDAVTVNFGEMSVGYNLDYGTETVRVAAAYGGSFSNDWITVDFVGGMPEDSGIFAADVRVYRRANGRVTLVAELKNIEFRILKSIDRATIVLNDNLKDDDGKYTVYLEDREFWEIFCTVEYFDGTSETVALSVADEDIELDKPYEFAPEYLGHQTEGVTLLIKNTAVSVVSYVSVNYWGEPFELLPIAVMADGTERQLSGGDWKYAEGSRFDEYGAIGVAQFITVEITPDSGLVKEGGAVSSQISVTPIDGLKRIELVDDYKKEYEYGDENFIVRYLRTVYYSGRTEIVAPSFDQITVIGFDPTVIVGAEYSCLQTVTIGYSDKTVEAEIEIINPVISVRPVGLSFDGEANAYLKDTASVRPFEFGLVYKNDATETVAFDGTPENYARDVLGKHTAVFNIRKENRLICTTTVNVLNCVSNVRQAAIADTATGEDSAVIPLKFGEAVNIGRFTVRYSTDFGAYSLNLDASVADTATKNYSLKRDEGGLSTVGVRVPALRDSSGKAVTFTVRINVAPRVNERMLTTVSAASGVEIKYDGKIVVLQNQTTVAELMSILKSDYLVLSYKGGTSEEFAGGYSEVGRNRVFETVELKNAEGTLIDSYKVCLVGDADGDGTVSSEDVSALAKRILENSTEIYDYEAAGGSLDLKSFVNMLKAQKESGEPI